jgi:tetratricopeptide (TPR) repeat protein
VSTAQGFDPKTSAPVMERAMTIWEGLAREDAANEDNLRGLASAHFSAFLQAPIPERGQAVVHMQTALEAFDKLLAARPADLDRKRNVSLCHKYLASHFLLVAPDEARAHGHARRAAELDAERLAAEPQNAQARMDYTASLGVLADVEVQGRRYDEALRQYERQLALRRELSEADATNVHARYGVAHSLLQIALVHVLAGRPHVAAGPLDECFALAATFAGTNVQGLPLTAVANLLRGEVALASKEDPCPAYRRMADLMDQAPNSDLLAVEVEMRDRALERLKTCPASGT